MDSKAIDMNCEYLGVSRLQLMENAGRQIAEHAREYKKIAVFAGTGNNGGDGLVAARHLACAGKKVRVYLAGGKRTDECQRNLDVILNTDVEVEVIGDSKDCEKIVDFSRYDLIVDALVGVGMRGELREPIKSMVETINKSNAFKLSVDVPSGNEKLKVNADLVLSFHTAKTPNAVVVDIGIPKEAELYCGPGDVYLAIPERKPNAHKGDYGRVLVVGGSRNYVGAPTLAALSALRAGADLAVICCPKSAAARIFDPNLIVRPLKSENYLSSVDVERILNLKFDVMILGNGLDTEEETRDAVREIIKKVEAPMVVDADALKLIKKDDVKPNMILTPHAREFETLFGTYDEEKRTKLVEKTAAETNSTILLKGRIDVISDGRRTRLNKTGNPSMTVGGTGDVLAGVVGGLAAQNKDLFQSACAGAFLTGLAGDLANREYYISMLATDVLNKIPEAIKTSLR